MTAPQSISPVTIGPFTDPADLWDAYLAETPRSHRSPQGAMAFAFDKLVNGPDAAAAALDREAVSKVVKHLLYNDDRERDYPVYRTQDDNGLEESEYVDFAMDVLAARTLNAAQPSPVLEFEYCNWEGRKSLRQARPISIRFGKTEWHPTPQWLMLAFDVDKGAEREFAMADMAFEEDALSALTISSTEGK